MRHSVARRIALLAATTLLAVVAVAPASASAAEARLINPPGPIHDGIFLSVCRFSHTAPDDPIVHPGHVGMSHQHDFFGNTTTNGDSTYRSLRAGGTTCRIGGDTAAYWVPSLYADGVRVPRSASTPTTSAVGERGV